MRRFHRDAPGIFYTPLNGGHWVVTRSAVAVEMLRKPALFSSDPKHNEANRRWPRTAPNQYDPPEHTNFRLILNPWFSPGIVARRTDEKIGRAHVCTPVTNAQLVCRLLLEKKKSNIR